MIAIMGMGSYPFWLGIYMAMSEDMGFTLLLGVRLLRAWINNCRTNIRLLQEPEVKSRIQDNTSNQEAGRDFVLSRGGVLV